MLSAERLALSITYLVTLGSALSLYGIADAPFFLGFTALIVAGLVNDFTARFYVSRFILNTAGILLSALFLLDLSLDNLVKPLAHVLLLLMAIKALEEKRPRDIHQMLLLSLFGLVVTTAFRFDPTFMVFFLYELYLGIIAFAVTTVYSELRDMPLSRSFLKSFAKAVLPFPLLVAIGSVPFFLILPRTSAPLFDITQPKKGGLISGISDRVTLGKVGEIQQDNTVVMRVFGSLPPDPYWRVSVFDTYRKNMWIKTRTGNLSKEEPPPQGRHILYRIVLEPTYDRYVPLLDYPLKVIKVEGAKIVLKRKAGGYYEASENISKPVKISALSVLAPPRDPPTKAHLRVPKDLPASVRELAKKLSEGKRSNEEKLSAVVEFFKEGFSYSLRLERPEGDPLEHFLFRSKRGNCEYFASATALLLRLMGVPARVVGGFKGVLKNEYGRYYIVTNSMAHVWVEAFVGGRWVRVDTTPPYVSPYLRHISKLDLLRDALVAFWYENVIDFSAKKQSMLLKGVVRSLKGISLQDVKEFLKYALLMVTALTFVYGGIVFYLRRLRKTPVNLYRLMVRRLERLEGRRLSDALPEELLQLSRGKAYGNYVEFIINLYRKDRFSDRRVTKEELEEGYRMLRKI